MKNHIFLESLFQSWVQYFTHIILFYYQLLKLHEGLGEFELKLFLSHSKIESLLCQELNKLSGLF